jgi:hypothetical protein
MESEKEWWQEMWNIRSTGRKIKAPNSKHQIPNKFQCSTFKTKLSWSFEIGIWKLFGICNLEIGI